VSSFGDLLNAFQLVAIIGGWIWVVARLGARLDALTLAVDRLTRVIDGHDERIRELEIQQGVRR
jgi:hypothetical protein